MRAMHAERKLWLEATALLAAVVLASMLAWPAHGQAPNAVQPGSAPCSPSLQPGAPGTVASAQEQPNPASPPDNLSNRLARSDGVICPPSNVDPGMKLPTPEAGNMPVIPPPGSPGGDPSIRPK